MFGISPYLSFPGNCREAIEFYKSALDAEVLFVQTVGTSPMSDMGPADNIMHCSMKAGSATLMMSDDMRPDSAPAAGGKISLAIGVNSAELAAKLFSNLAEGGTVLMPLEKTYWAEAFGMVTDRFGFTWMVNCEAPRE